MSNKGICLSTKLTRHSTRIYDSFRYDAFPTMLLTLCTNDSIVVDCLLCVLKVVEEINMGSYVIMYNMTAMECHV